MTTIIVDAVARSQDSNLIELELRCNERLATMTAWNDSTLDDIALLMLNTDLPNNPSQTLQRRFIIEAHKEEDTSPETGEPYQYWVVDDVQIEPLPQDAAKLDFTNLPGWATWSAQGAGDWIDANVTDLASAKNVLQNMAKAIVYLRDYVRIVTST